MASDVAPQESKRMVAGILAILFGGYGVHKFVLGMPLPGGIMLGVSLASCVAGFICAFIILIPLPAVGMMIMGVIGLIEGIIYLTKTDEEFIRVYQVGKKQWF